ncbi:MAG: isochorismatase family protein [Boseongicola sp.]|nr:MAG: isochorismatase family protein [Boseongicola sp.]
MEVIIKVRERAFLGVQTLIVAGITTHWAVEGTVRVAADRGFDCIILTDCVASANISVHEEALERMDSISRLATSSDVIISL